jgi:hypothetical protein
MDICPNQGATNVPFSHPSSSSKVPSLMKHRKYKKDQEGEEDQELQRPQEPQEEQPYKEHPNRKLVHEDVYDIYFEQLIPELGGLINATRMCKEEGKVISTFLRNAEAQKFLLFLRSQPEFSEEQIMQTWTSGPLRGTWIHPVLAIHLATWLSPRMLVSTFNFLNNQKMATFSHNAKEEKKELVKEVERNKELVEIMKVKYKEMEHREKKAVDVWHEQVQVERCYNAYENHWKTVYDYMLGVYRIKLSEADTKALDKLAVASLKQKYGDQFYLREWSQWDKYKQLVDRKPSFKVDVIPPPVPSIPMHFKKNTTPKTLHVFDRVDWDVIEDNCEKFVDKHRQQTIEEYGY